MYMALKLLGTREQKENKAGNTGTKAVFGEQGTTKSKKILFGNKGTQGKFCLEQGNKEPLGGPHLYIADQYIFVKATVKTLIDAIKVCGLLTDKFQFNRK